jgi:hypothetical protein
MNEYEAHLSSYDHSHKQRLKDMKAMVRDPGAAARARRQEARADGVISIKLGDATSGTNTGSVGTGFKKGGFKKTGFKAAFVPTGGDDDKPMGSDIVMKPAENKVEEDDSRPAVKKSQLVESDTDDEGYEVYDPRFPTD